MTSRLNFSKDETDEVIRDTANVRIPVTII